MPDHRPAPGPVVTSEDPQKVPRACAVDPDTHCPVCAARGREVRMFPVKAHYQCPECRYFDSCCM